MKCSNEKKDNEIELNLEKLRMLIISYRKEVQDTEYLKMVQEKNYQNLKKNDKERFKI